MSSRKRRAESTASKSDLPPPPPRKRSKRSSAKHEGTEAVAQPDLRFSPPEGFEVVPPSSGRVGEILADALAKPNKEIWLVAVPRDFDVKKLYGKKPVIGTSMTLTNRKSSNKAVADHFELKTQRLPRDGKRMSVLVRTSNGIQSAGPVTTSLVVKRVVHLDAVCRPAAQSEIAARKIWTAPAPLSGTQPDGETGFVDLIRQRRTMIGSAVPVVKCGYAETKRLKKEMKKKKSQKKKRSLLQQETFDD